MGNKAKRRKQQQEQRWKVDRLLTVFGVAAGLAAWGYSMSAASPNPIIATLLFSSSVCLLLWAAWVHFNWMRAIKVAIVVAVLCAFGAADWKFVLNRPVAFCYGILLQDGKDGDLVLAIANSSGKTINNVTVGFTGPDATPRKHIEDIPNAFFAAIYSGCGTAASHIHAPLKGGSYGVFIGMQDGLYISENIDLTINPWSQKVTVAMIDPHTMEFQRNLLVDYSPPIDQYGGCDIPPPKQP